MIEINSDVRCLKSVFDDYIKYVQYKINQRPRLRLNFSSTKKLSLSIFINLHLLVESTGSIFLHIEKHSWENYCIFAS